MQLPASPSPCGRRLSRPQQPPRLRRQLAARRLRGAPGSTWQAGAPLAPEAPQRRARPAGAAGGFFREAAQRRARLAGAAGGFFREAAQRRARLAGAAGGFFSAVLAWGCGLAAGAAGGFFPDAPQRHARPAGAAAGKVSAVLARGCGLAAGASGRPVPPAPRSGRGGLALQALFCGGLLLALLAAPALAQTPLPGVSIQVGRANSPQDVATSLQILVILTILTLAPSILIMTTSFTRVVIVLAFLRQALGANQSPPTQVLVGLALFLTFFIMQPVWKDVHDNAFRPYVDRRLSQEQALTRAGVPLKAFMQKFVREKDLALFMRIAKLERPKTLREVPLYVLIPAFMISELKTAFQIGFLIYMPFLVIDLVVAAVLMAMGMMMLPPVLISLPLKLMLFVLVDGWNLLVGTLVSAYFVSR